MSLPEALLKWLSLANHQDSDLTALQVSDGITMSQVLHKIDPKHFTQVTPPATPTPPSRTPVEFPACIYIFFKNA
jgi:hypothetical protein